MNGAEPRRHWALFGWAAVLVGSVLGCAWYSGIDIGAGLRAGDMGVVGEVLAGFAGPDTTPATLQRIALLAIDSVCIGILGTALALVAGVVLALVAARLPGLVEAPGEQRYRRAIHDLTRLAARWLLALFRAVPEIVWAFLFVRVFGLGPGAAVLAIGLSFAGILGKLYAELVEAVDPRPARTLRAAGASRMGTFAFGVLPLVRAQWVAYALFRLECAIRSGAILGIVGAGGLGQEIELSLRYYQFDKLATALLAVLFLVVALEAASRILRRQSARTLLAVTGLGAGGALFWLDIPWVEILAAGTHIAGFVAGFSQPTGSSAFLWNAARHALDTVAMAWWATATAALAGLALAPLAAWTFAVGHYLPAPPGRSGGRAVVAGTVLAVARLALQISRALPELVWALLFILWVGPGITAGALAVCAHTIGILGRLYGDVLEEAEVAPLRLLETMGAARLAWFIYGALPQVAPRLLSYTLYRFEVNIRMTTMVGFVGAGGLGDALHTALSLFHMRDLAALLLVLIAVVVIADTIGDRLRARLLRGGRL